MPYDSMKALDYAIKNGTVFETYKLEVVLGLGKDNRIPLEFFKSVQNDDGGFAHNLIPENASSVESTLKMLPWFDELELSFSGAYKKTINYLLDVRNPKGYWDESDAIITKGVGKAKNKKIRVELTSEAASMLYYLEDKEHLASKAVKYLETQTDAKGVLKCSTHASWSLYSLYGQLGMNDKKEKLEKVLFGLKEESADAILFSLNCMRIANGPKEKTKELLDNLESLQEENGSWKSSNGSDINTTIEAIRTLKRYHR